ncbi:MAG TPA: hypothetical protein VFJ66_10100 [Gaiellales bacterium]|nr:hypothetical protein [Gaiellales bacterium]
MPNPAPDTFTPADAARLVALQARVRRDIGARLHERIVQPSVAGALRVDQLTARVADAPHAAELRSIFDGIRSTALAMMLELRSTAEDFDFMRLTAAWARECGLPLDVHTARPGPWPDGVAAETAAWWATVELLVSSEPERARIRLVARRGATVCVILAQRCHAPHRAPHGFELCRMLGATVTLRASDRRTIAAIRFPPAS